MDSETGSNTYCPECQKLLIDRAGYFVKRNMIFNGMCPTCKTKIAGIWE